MIKLGAQGVGERQDLIDTTNNRATDLCVLFGTNDMIVPIATFAAARIIPIISQAANFGIVALDDYS